MPQETPLTSLDLDSRLTAAGAAAETFARLSASLWKQPYVSAELLELCRLTLARLHQDGVEIAAGNPHLAAGSFSPAKRAAVLEGKAHRDSAFCAAEQAVLQFAECFAIDAQSITNEAADGVKTHLGEAGLVFFIEALGCLDARIRAARCLRDLDGVHPGGAHAH